MSDALGAPSEPRHSTRTVQGPFSVDPAAALTAMSGTAGRGSARAGAAGAGDEAAVDVVVADMATADVATASVMAASASAPSAAAPSVAAAAASVAAAATAPTAAQTSQQYTLAAGKAVKLSVRQEGWYRVAASALTAAGMPATASFLTLRLFVNGAEQDLLVQQQSGRVTAAEFYATGVDTPWSDTQVYWLTWGGQTGQRVLSTNGRGTGTAPTSFPFTVQWTPRQMYFAALKNGDANHFFGPGLGPNDPVTQVLPVTNVAGGTSGTATVQVRMQGATAGAHAAGVEVNGTLLGLVTFQDQESGVSSFTFPSTALATGAALRLTALGGGNDVTLVDTVALTYPHAYAADGDALR